MVLFQQTRILIHLSGKGAQQPGMTGQVKEDILSRFGELGVYVNNGKLLFNPRLLRPEEFLKESVIFKYTDIRKESKQIELKKGSLAFTYCQIPVIYKKAENNHLEVIYNNGLSVEFEKLSLDVETSKKVFSRTGEVNRIIVSVKK